MVVPYRGHLRPCRHQAQWGRLKAKELAIAMETLGTDQLRYQLDVAIEERDHARRIATLSTNMLSEVVAHVMGDEEVHDST